MSTDTLIRRALDAGVELRFVDGQLRVAGRRSAVAAWAPQLALHKAALIEALQSPAIDWYTLDRDPQAIRILLDRVLPSLRPVELPTPLDMPNGNLAEQAHAVVQAAADGDIAPGQAAQIIAALGGVAKIVESTELVARIEALEKHHGKS